MPTAPSAESERARPPASAGASSGAYWLTASAMSRTSSNELSALRGALNVVRLAAGVAAEKSSKTLTNDARDSPSAYTSTRSTTPESGSIHTEAWSMLEASDAGTTRKPGASMPATVRAGSRVTSSALASVTTRVPSSGGTRSEVRGSRMSGSRLITASSFS